MKKQHLLFILVPLVNIQIVTVKPWYSIYGIDPIINFNTNGKVLPSTALINTLPIVRLRKWVIEYTQ